MNSGKRLSRPKNRCSLVLGLTGGFGTGKSAVAAYLKKLGAEVVDADEIVHTLLDCDPGVRRRLERLFGASVYKDGRADRSAIGRVVFRDPAALTKLEQCLHPKVAAEIHRRVSASRKRLTVIDAAVLFEAGWDRFTDCVLAVRLPRELQVKRAMRRTGLCRAEVLRRIRRQLPDRRRCALADYVLDNSGTLAVLEGRVRNLYTEIINRDQEAGSS